LANVILSRREFLSVPLALSAAALAPASQRNENIVSLGKLGRFWRFSAALGPYLETGNALIDVPSYMLQGDFPYLKRPFLKEALFADQLTVVRLLGGYVKPGLSGAELQKLDLAYRGDDGTIHYRMELLRPRLQPYLDNGYRDITLVLDNVPYCFPSEPKIATFGQIAPPRDPAEWKAFVREVAREVLGIVGSSGASRLRFRVGSECNGRERFDGSQAQYERHYQDTAAAIREIMPDVPVSFYNISRVNVRSIPSQNVDSFALARSCFARTPQVPVDFIAFSRYYWQQDDPEQVGQQCRAVWDEFGSLVPELRGASREVQEFGIATWQMTAHGQIARSEPGALGAAQLLQMLFCLREARVNRVWHWSVLDTQIRDHAGVRRSLPTGQAWVYSVLEHMADGDAFLLRGVDSEGGIKRMAVGSWKVDSVILAISAYHPDGTARPSETVEFQLPPSGFGFKTRTTRIARLNGSNCVHSMARDDLATHGMLAGVFTSHPEFLGTVREMAASREGEVLIAQNESKYLDAWVRSLTLQPFTSQDGAIGESRIRVRIASPEVVVLAVNR
jgi:hypothetical protein